MKVRCPKCTMTFEIGEPRETAAERSVCPECAQAFWNSSHRSISRIVVGMLRAPAGWDVV